MRLSDDGRAVSVFGLALVVAGLLFQRLDLALIGVPFVLVAAWGLARPGAPDDLRLELRPVIDDEAGAASRAPGEIVTTVCLGRPAPSDSLARIRLSAPGHRSQEVLVAASQDGFEAAYTSLRTGPQAGLGAQAMGFGPLGLAEGDVRRAEAPRRLALPRALPLGAVPVPRQLRGVAGSRTTRRLGDGPELYDVHPADGVARRIDWRTTARRSPDLSQIFRRRTYGTGEAVAVLVVDSRDDLGPDLATWTGFAPTRVDEATSLDLARHAAASVATALIESGDRVGLADVGTMRHTMAPAGGRRHLRRLIHALALTAPAGATTPGLAGSARRVRAPVIPTGCIVYLFSTLLDDEALRLVRAWQETRHVVVVVDTLPVVRPPTRRAQRLAWDITRLERTDRIAALRAHGVPVIAWTARDRTAAARTLRSWAVSLARAPVVAGAPR